MLLASLVYALLTRSLLQGLSRLREQNPGFSPQSEANTDLNVDPALPRLAVLIAARDEAENLPDLLTSLMHQDYPADAFTVWVVDDRSADSTPRILAEFAAKYSGRLHYRRVEKVPAGVSPKKHALSLALKEAKGDIFVTTDADCRMSPKWLRTVARHFTPETGLVLGLTTYTRNPKARFGQGIADLEFASYAFVAASLVGLGFPVTGNANNIAYRREAHEDQKKTLRHDHLISGDDDFLLQGIHATGKWKIRYMLAPESAVTTAPPDNARHFWEQRKRWASKCLHYQPRQVVFLGLIYAYYAGILLGLLLAGLGPIFGCIALGAFILKTSCDYLVMRKATALFGQSDLMRSFIGAALLHIPLIVFAVIAGSLGSFTWKGQAFKTKAH